MDFSTQSFLPKEAGILPQVQRLLRFGKPVSEALKPVPEGKFVTNLEQTGLGEGQPHRFYSPDEIAAHRRKEIDEEGSGSFPVDMLSGIANRVTPNSWDLKGKTLSALRTMKKGLTSADTQAGQFAGGGNFGSLRGKLFSVPTGKKGMGVRIGDKPNPDGSISPIMEGTGADRRPSLVAPVQNAIHVATPFLAATYVADKLYPRDQPPVPPQQEQQAAFTASNYLEKMAEKNITKFAENDIVEEGHLVWSMEKEAMMQKTAELQEQLEKVGSQLQNAYKDIELLNKQASQERKEKERISAEFQSSKRDILNKKADYEEFRLRTIARERSHHVVKLADNMLELGIIKQAQLDSEIDKLMECDEPTFNLICSTVKQASKKEEGLESLADLSHYSNNDLESTSARPVLGLSKSGQTIGEAARDLISK